MNNIALITRITGEHGSNVVAHLKGEKRYNFSFKVKGDFRLQFFCTEEDSGNRMFAINRYALVTTGSYEYTIRTSEDAILEYTMRHEGEAYDIVVEEDK